MGFDPENNKDTVQDNESSHVMRDDRKHNQYNLRAMTEQEIKERAEQVNTLQGMQARLTEAQPNRKVTSIDKVLQERGKEYGDFKTHALLTQNLEQIFYQFMLLYNPEQVKTITPSEKEAIHMIFHKLGRIGNGNPHNKDSWKDIAGYSMLVANELEF